MASGSNPNSDEDIYIATRILEDLFIYLRTNLSIDNNLASELLGWKPPLLGSPEYKRIRALNDQGKDDDAFQTWFSFATSGYLEESLVELCKCLRKAEKDGRKKLKRVADKIETAMKSCRSDRSASTEENNTKGSNSGRKRPPKQSSGSTKRKQSTQPGKWSLDDRCLFMSHSSKDKNTVDKIVQSLRGLDIKVWYDKDEIRTGDPWDEKIAKDMPNMYGFICCMSEDFFKSKICKRELETFISAQRLNPEIPENSIFPVIVVDPALCNEVRQDWQMILSNSIHRKKWNEEKYQFLQDMEAFVKGITQAGSGNPPGPSTSDVIKSIEDFLPYTSKLEPYLTQLGTVLGISDHALAIEESPGDPNSKVLKILKHWIDVTPGRTWKLFYDNLGKSHIFEDVRLQIRKKHNIPGSTPTPSTNPPGPQPTTVIHGGDLSVLLGKEYEDVVKKNACITLHISKCTTIGPPRVGKTCLKYLLTGRKWDKHKGTASTDVMEAPEWVEVHRESGEDTLECLSRDKCKELLMNDVAAGDFDYMQPKNKDETANNNPKPSKVREPQGKPEGKHASSLVVSSAAIECLEESLKHDDFQEQLQEAKRAQEEFHKAGRESTSMRAMKFLHFIDTGGQRIYHDVHPVLITSPSVYLVVINLVDFAVKHDILPPQTPHSKSVSEALYSRNPEVLDTTESPKVPTRHSKDLDAMELAEHALRSIYTFTTKSPGESEAAEEGYLQIHPKRPKVFIIGTHLDLIHSNDPEERKKCLKELNGKIVQMVKAKAYTRFIQYDDQDCCLWAVDNTLAGHREEQKKTGSDKYLQLFRGLILEESMMFEVTVPIKWQLFEHLTSQQSHFGYNELLQFACSRKFCDSKREFQLMLEVFHILGLYFFKIPQGYEAQSGIVFTKPNVLYKTTSELLWAAVDHVQSTGERLIDAKAVLQGLIAEEKVIKIDVNWFICLLCDLRLMAKLSNSASKQHLYVIPAALPISERAKGALQFSVSPLLVTFTSPRSRVSFLPSGLFCALMSDLLGQSRYTPHRDKLYRNCIVLSVPGQDSNVTYGELYISEKEFFIEITFRTTPSCSFTWVAEIAEICMAIRDYLEQRIGIVWRKIYEEHNFLEVMEEIQSDDCREAIIWGFPCHFHPEGAHIAKYLSASQGSCARCLDPRSSLIGAVFDSQCVWFSKLNGQLSFKDGVLVVPDKNVHTVPQQDTPMECT